MLGAGAGTMRGRSLWALEELHTYRIELGNSRSGFTYANL